MPELGHCPHESACIDLLEVLRVSTNVRIKMNKRLYSVQKLAKLKAEMEGVVCDYLVYDLCALSSCCVYLVLLGWK